MWNFHRKKPDKNPVLLIENETSRFFMTYDDDQGCFVLPMIKLKNLIGISKDSVYKWEKHYPIDSLESILKTDLLNNGIDNKFADNPKQLIIQFLNPYKESIEDLEGNLLTIFKIYNNIKSQTKDSLQLNIDFNELIVKPPPPIKQNENNNEE